VGRRAAALLHCCSWQQHSWLFVLGLGLLAAGGLLTWRAQSAREALAAEAAASSSSSAELQPGPLAGAGTSWRLKKWDKINQEVELITSPRGGGGGGGAGLSASLLYSD
jgi:hypothetical protein